MAARLQLLHWRDLRLIMITDLPGMGKPRQAMAAAHTLQYAFADGVIFLSLRAHFLQSSGLETRAFLLRTP